MRKPVTKLWLSAKRMKVSGLYSTLESRGSELASICRFAPDSLFPASNEHLWLANETLLKTGGLYRKKVAIQPPIKKVFALRFYRSTKTSLSLQ